MTSTVAARKGRTLKQNDSPTFDPTHKSRLTKQTALLNRAPSLIDHTQKISKCTRLFQLCFYFSTRKSDFTEILMCCFVGQQVGQFVFILPAAPAALCCVEKPSMKSHNACTAIQQKQNEPFSGTTPIFLCHMAKQKLFDREHIQCLPKKRIQCTPQHCTDRIFKALIRIEIL